MRDGALRVFHELQATSHEPVSKTPTPTLPKGEGCLLCYKTASRRRRVALKPRTTSDEHNYKPQATGHKLVFSIPRTKLALPVESRGPCSGRRRSYGYYQLANHGPQATSYRPYSRHHHYVPCTTHHEPVGRTHVSAPTASDTPRATSYRPHAACRRFVIPAK